MQAQSMRVDHSSSPLVLALQLAQAVQSGAVVDVLFSNNTASVALQAMALARTNIASSGQDMVLLPQQTDSSSGSGASQLNALRYKARAIPTTLLLQVNVYPHTHRTCEEGLKACSTAYTSFCLPFPVVRTLHSVRAFGLGGLQAQAGQLKLHSGTVRAGSSLRSTNCTSRHVH
eukprot:scaffold143827_cov22-Tisochrysis_lutea.AAC.1